VEVVDVQSFGYLGLPFHSLGLDIGDFVFSDITRLYAEVDFAVAMTGATHVIVADGNRELISGPFGDVLDRIARTADRRFSDPSHFDINQDGSVSDEDLILLLVGIDDAADGLPVAATLDLNGDGAVSEGDYCAWCDLCEM
jgi:hypothetical protein